MRRRARRLLVGAALLAVLLPLTAVALRAAIRDTRGCADTIALRVAAAPDIAPALTEIAAALPEGALRVNGDCVHVDVTAAASPAVATLLLNGAAGTSSAPPSGGVRPGRVPDVWVPESRAWTLRVEAETEGTRRPILSSHQVSVAYDPVGLALPEKTAVELPDVLDLAAWDGEEFTVDLPDPREDAAALAALAAFDNADRLDDVNVTAGRSRADALDGGGAVPMSACDLAERNAADPGHPLVLMSTSPEITGFDFPYAPRADLSGRVSQAADKFLAVLDDPERLAVLASSGLTAPDAHRPALTGAAVSGVLDSMGENGG